MAHPISKLHPSLTKAIEDKKLWPAFQSYTIALSRISPSVKDPGILLKLSPMSIFSEATPKVQGVLAHAASVILADKIFRSLPSGPPTSGPTAGLHMPEKDKPVRIQAIANREKTSSAWISANPLLRHCRMSDTSFKIAWKIRTLQPLLPQDHYCKCGAELDRLGYHFYVCPDKTISSKVRYQMHNTLKEAVALTGNSYFSIHSVKAHNKEPQMKDYFRPLPTSSPTRQTSSQQSEEDDTNPLRNPMERIYCLSPRQR